MFEGVLKDCGEGPGCFAFGYMTGGENPSGFGTPSPGAVDEAQAGDWSSRSVGELEAFLRSRGVDPGEGVDQADLVQIVTALAAEELEG
jgi:hypothetical protein